jgi:hypothetical protein
MKKVIMPFGISEIAGTNYYAVKMTANISNNDMGKLMAKYPINVLQIPRKDGKPSTADKITAVLPQAQVWDFLSELRLAIIDRKIADLYDERMKIINPEPPDVVKAGMDMYDDLPW